VEEVKRRHESRLMKMRGVVGVGIGRKDGRTHPDYVEKDSPRILEALPAAIEEVPVEVVVSERSRRSERTSHGGLQMHDSCASASSLDSNARH